MTTDYAKLNTKSDYVVVKINIPRKIARAHQSKFPQLKVLRMVDLLNELVKDELKDLSIFDPKYYKDEDIKEIFNL